MKKECVASAKTLKERERRDDIAAIASSLSFAGRCLTCPVQLDNTTLPCGQGEVRSVPMPVSGGQIHPRERAAAGVVAASIAAQFSISGAFPPMAQWSNAPSPRMEAWV